MDDYNNTLNISDERLQEILSRCSERELQVLRVRLGLDDGKAKPWKKQRKCSVSPVSVYARSRTRHCGAISGPVAPRKSPISMFDPRSRPYGKQGVLSIDLPWFSWYNI